MSEISPLLLKEPLLISEEEIERGQRYFAREFDRLGLQAVTAQLNFEHPAENEGFQHTGVEFTAIYVEHAGQSLAFMMPHEDTHHSASPEVAFRYRSRGLLRTMMVPRAEQLVALHPEKNLIVSKQLPGKRLSRMDSTEINEISEEHFVDAAATLATTAFCGAKFESDAYYEIRFDNGFYFSGLEEGDTDRTYDAAWQYEQFLMTLESALGMYGDTSFGEEWEAAAFVGFRIAHRLFPDAGFDIYDE